MKLQQKPMTLEAVLWTGATLSEWPDWVKEGFLKDDDEFGRLYRQGSSLMIWRNKDTQSTVVAGQYIVYDGTHIWIENFDNLAKAYDRIIPGTTKTMALKQIDACNLEADDLYEEEDCPSPGKAPAPKKRGF